MSVSRDPASYEMPRLQSRGFGPITVIQTNYEMRASIERNRVEVAIYGEYGDIRVEIWDRQEPKPVRTNLDSLLHGLERDEAMTQGDREFSVLVKIWDSLIDGAIDQMEPIRHLLKI